jgi:hypothetical protein
MFSIFYRENSKLLKFQKLEEKKGKTIHIITGSVLLMYVCMMTN